MLGGVSGRADGSAGAVTSHVVDFFLCRSRSMHPPHCAVRDGCPQVAHGVLVGIDDVGERVGSSENVPSEVGATGIGTGPSQS